MQEWKEKEGRKLLGTFLSLSKTERDLTKYIGKMRDRNVILPFSYLILFYIKMKYKTVA